MLESSDSYSSFVSKPPYFLPCYRGHSYIKILSGVWVWNNSLRLYHRQYLCVSGIITIDILDGKPQTPDGLVYSYLVKKIMQPFKVQANPPKPKAVGYGKDEKPATPIAKMTKGGIKLRERTAPLKYTVDDDLNLTDDDDDDVPFPTTRQVIEEWLPEVDSYIQTFLLDLFLSQHSLTSAGWIFHRSEVDIFAKSFLDLSMLNECS